MERRWNQISWISNSEGSGERDHAHINSFKKFLCFFIYDLGFQKKKKSTSIRSRNLNLLQIPQVYGMGHLRPEVSTDPVSSSSITACYKSFLLSC